MSVFVDSSAFLAILDRGDGNHGHAGRTWADLVTRKEVMVTSNYVVVETMALLQRRSNTTTLRRFQADLLPVVNVEWIGKAVHSVGVSAALTSGKRGPSLVDCVSFEVMRQLDIRTAFCYDKHFANAGFGIL